MDNLHDDRNKQYAGKVKRVLEKLTSGFVIVEGAHDIAALGKLGIKSFSYSQVASKKSVPNLKDCVYILTDSDNGGEDKKNKLISTLLELNCGCKINVALGMYMLKLLNITSVEQMCGPVAEALAENNKK